MIRWSAALTITACLLAAGPAQAFPVADDVAEAQKTLPAGHPCKPPTAIKVQLVPALRSSSGRRLDGEAPQGVVLAGQWFAVATTGVWMALPCVVRLDSTERSLESGCWGRRVVFHEVGHLGGRAHAGAGLMSEWADERDQATVPACRALLPPLRDRVESRILELVPGGWAVACGPRHGRVLACVADDGRRACRYRARVTGGTFTLARVSR